VLYGINTTLKEEDISYESKPSVLLRSSFISHGFFDDRRHGIRQTSVSGETN
jgi:hypothetical protein